MLNDSPLARQERRYARRRKGLKGLLALILISTTAVVVVGLWAAFKHKAAVTSSTGDLPKDVARRLSGYTFTRSEKNRQIFTIHAARTLAYNRGSSTVLEDVHVVMFGRAGNRHDEIDAQRCSYDTVTGALACQGRASITVQASPAASPSRAAASAPPVVIHTSEVSYDPHQSVVKTDQPVRFQDGEASGAAVGLAYNTKSGDIELRKAVSIELKPRTKAGSPVRVTAGNLTYSKFSGEVTLRAPVKIIQANTSLAAATGTLYLNSSGHPAHARLEGSVRGLAIVPAGYLQGSAGIVDAIFAPKTSRLQQLSASGSVELRMEQRGSGNLRRLSAGHVLLKLSGEKARPEAGTASGNVRLVFETRAQTVQQLSPPTRAVNPGGEVERVLTASELDFRFQDAGDLAAASTPGAGKLRVIPGDPSRARQTITAGRLLMSFVAGGRLKQLRGFSGSRIISQPGPMAPHGDLPMTSTSAQLSAMLDPASGRINTLRQTGNFKFQEGDRYASADASLYRAATQTLTLLDHPLIWDATERIRAQHVQLRLAAGIAKGWGHVQSVHFETPAVVPLIVLADRVTARRDTQLVHYEGHVRAWRGPDLIQSPTLDIYKAQERISSGPGVLASLVQEGVAPGKPKPKTGTKPAGQPLNIRADRLLYFNLGREAVFSGDVQASSGSATLRAEHLEVFFARRSAPGDPLVARAVADRNVAVMQLPGRRATGQHAEYFADSGKIILTGGPPVLYDEKQGFLTAVRLTFSTHDASLIADGGRKAPTLSKYRVPRQ